MVSTQIFNFGPKCYSQGTCGCPRPPGSSKSGRECSILAGIGFSLFGMNFYGCDQLLDYAFLLQLKVCAFRTPLQCTVNSTVIPVQQTGISVNGIFCTPGARIIFYSVCYTVRYTVNVFSFYFLVLEYYQLNSSMNMKPLFIPAAQ